MESKRFVFKKIYVVDGEEKKFPLEVVIHSNKSGVIIINYPGFGGHIDGYMEKHQKIANMLSEKNIGAVVRIANNVYRGTDYKKTLLDDLRFITNYTLENSEEICGKQDPIIYMIGTSAGGSAVAVVAPEFSQVQRILLIAPSGDAGMENVEQGLKEYEGEIYIAIGLEDEVVGWKNASWYLEKAIRAKKKEMELIPNCDHHFAGIENGKILAKASLWAFDGEKTFPSPEGGLNLFKEPVSLS
jgi:hypothetical protein